MGRLANSTLGMGYVIAFLELIIAPVTPSSTARAAGIIFPIVNSAAVALGSNPDEATRRRCGAYFIVTLYMATKTTSYLFLTAMAPNALAAKFVSDILHVGISWMMWSFAALVPGMIMLLLIPLLIFVLYPPELKKIDGKAIAREGLEKLGPMSRPEKMLVCVFLAALIAWIIGPMVKVDAGNIAVAALTACILLDIISWKDMASNKSAWHTLMWFGGIVGIAGVLAKAKFFTWLAALLGNHLNLGISSYMMVAIILTISVFIRYLFASSTAYVVSMMPVFCTVGLAAGCDPAILGVGLLFTNGYGGCLTHFGGGSGPVLYGSGYPDIKGWWMTGAVCATVSLAVHLTIGYAWWSFIGLK